MSSRLALEMGRRVGLKAATAAKVYLGVKHYCVMRGYPNLDRVLLAQAIKYVADNRIHLREIWK